MHGAGAWEVPSIDPSLIEVCVSALESVPAHPDDGDAVIFISVAGISAPLDSAQARELA
jgi:predicted naringenin-chalcone synthase